MDGNGRWAKSRGLPRIKGHEAGAQAVRECVEGCGELKVEYLTLYAFSAENWQRPRAEIIALMRLLEKFLKEKTPELLEKNVRLQAIGRLTDLPRSAQEQLHKSIEQTAGNTGLTLILALSYGGRLEIIDGIKSLLRAIELGHIDRAMIDVAMFSKHLYTRYYPDPDLLIRTSGEMRLSNFLLWQTSYTEMYVTPKLWPDFKARSIRRSRRIRQPPATLRSGGVGGNEAAVRLGRARSPLCAVGGAHGSDRPTKIRVYSRALVVTNGQRYEIRRSGCSCHRSRTRYRTRDCFALRQRRRACGMRESDGGKRKKNC